MQMKKLIEFYEKETALAQSLGNQKSLNPALDFGTDETLQRFIKTMVGDQQEIFNKFVKNLLPERKFDAKDLLSKFEMYPQDFIYLK
jgi:hypothetical protein